MTRRAWICGKAERACGRAARALLSLSEVFHRAGGEDPAPAEDEAVLPEVPEVPDLGPPAAVLQQPAADVAAGDAGSVAARLRAAHRIGGW